MNIEDKINLLNGKDVWHTYNIDRLNVKSIMMADGPHGLRKQADSLDNIGARGSYPATLFPAAATAACTFYPLIIQKMGEAIGREARSAGVHVVLGPGINIKRNPLCGRNFEYFSEDPYLAGVMASAWIRGAQKYNVGTSLKHYAANNQETYRFTINSVVDERALREIYLKGFEIAIREKPATVMASYNKINGEYACESKYLLTDILRDEWKYEGVVVSDWGAVYDRAAALKAGLDLEMPSSHGYNAKLLLEAYKKGEISVDVIDRSVDRIIKMVKKHQDNEPLNFDAEKHHEIAREIARHGIVLLKNDGVLPFGANEKIAVIGEFARNPRLQGGGSSAVNPLRFETVLSEISAFTDSYAFYPGYTLAGDGFSQELIDEAVAGAKDADKVLIVAGLPETYESEGYDREDLDLPKGQLALIAEVAKANPNVVVSLFAGAPVAMPFIENAKGILFCHLLGAASGQPLLEIVFGSVSPSGRLATTFPVAVEDDPSTKNFADGNNAVWYAESIYVGYRYYTTFDKKVLFPFGYGLSYTSFSYSGLTVDSQDITRDGKIKVAFKVKNAGTRPAYEVVQLYVENNDSEIDKPKRELRRFDKIYLEAGEEKTVAFELEYSDFSYYDVDLKRYHVDRGKYKIQVGKNANDIELEAEVERKENDPDYIPRRRSYPLPDFSASKFAEVLGMPLPAKSVIRKRPFSMNATLNDLKRTLIGKILVKMVKKEALKAGGDASPVVREMILKSLMETPVRTLAVMSGGKVKPKTMELIIRLINFGRLGK